MITFLKNLFAAPTFDPLIEGMYADQYAPELQAELRSQYLDRWSPDRQPRTPFTHPWLFDPCAPPQGWRYDPYYECWVNFKE